MASPSRRTKGLDLSILMPIAARSGFHDDVCDELHVERNDDGGDQRGQSGEPAWSNKLAHFISAGTDHEKRDDREWKLHPENHLAQDQELRGAAIAVVDRHD